VQLDSRTSSEIVETQGRYLITSFWGEYIAFVCDRSKRSALIVHCPAAARPAYRARVGAVHLYFSELADVVGLAPISLDVNWDYIAAYLIAPIHQTTETALRHVSAMIGGQCDRVTSAGIETRRYWSLAAFARQPREDSPRLIEDLREILIRCVTAWASCFRAIVHQLSGGLDSSIVYACLGLAPTRPEITCVTHYGNDAGTDERKFARVAAETGFCRHIELPLHEPADLDAWEQVALCPRPDLYLSVEQEQKVIAVAQSVNAAGITTGNGGDGVFYEHANIQLVSDYLKNRGVGRDLIRVILDTAAIANVSIGAVLRAAAAGLKRRRPENVFMEMMKWKGLPSAAARAIVCDDPERFVSPLVREAQDLSCAKYAHVRMMSRAFSVRSKVACWNDPERRSPIDSEIVKEFCASVPAHALCRNGQRRGLARAAFVGKVSSLILRREGKGDPTTYVNGIADRYRKCIDERLCDGELARRGLVDRAAIGGVGNENGPSGATERIGAYCVELWAEKMRSAAQQARSAFAFN